MVACGGFLWEVATGKKLRALAADIFSPDGKILAGGGRTICFCEAATGKKVLHFQGQILQGHCDTVSCLAFSADGKMLASGGKEGTVRLWERDTGKELHRFEDNDNLGIVTAVEFSPDGKSLAFTGAGVHVRDISTGKEIRTLGSRFDDRNFCLAFSADGKKVYSGVRNRDGPKNGGPHPDEIYCWDVNTGREVRRFPVQLFIGGAVFSSDASVLATRGSFQDGVIRLWDVPTGKELRQLTGEVSYLAFSPGGKVLASLENSERTLRLWDVSAGREIRRLPLPPQSASTLVFSSDGRFLAWAGADKVIRLVNAATGKELGRLVGHDGAVEALAFSPDGRFLASGSSDTTVLIWDVRVAAAENR